MNKVIKPKIKKQKRLTSLLGLTLDGSRLEGVVLRRNNDSLQMQQTFSVMLTLDPLTAAPELVGREIRNHLDAVGVRERNCIVGVPLKWALTAHAEMPELSGDDAASFLQLEAERGFPCDVATLRLAESFSPLPGGKQHVIFAGIPNSHLTLLEQVLAAAKLKPVSFSLGLSALQSPSHKDSDGVLALAIGDSQVGLQITCGGGVAALRALEGAIENEAGRRILHADNVAREMRITLGQLPAELRDKVKRIRIFGPRELAQQLADEMELRFKAMGMGIEVVTAYGPNDFRAQLPVTATLSPSFSLAARRLLEQSPTFEFLPPKPTLLQTIAAKYSSGRLRTVGTAVAAVVLIVVGLFLYQQWQLIRLRKEWTGMEAKVVELTKLSDKISKYQPWFDESYRSLSILDQLTKVFPERGTVTVKTIEIRDGKDAREGTVVTCSGSATDNTALLKMLSDLEAAKANGVSGVKPLLVRTDPSKIQYSFEFNWKKKGGGI